MCPPQRTYGPHPNFAERQVSSPRENNLDASGSSVATADSLATPLATAVAAPALWVVAPVAACADTHPEAIQAAATAVAAVPHGNFIDEVLSLEIHFPPGPVVVASVRARPATPPGVGVAVHSPRSAPATAARGLPGGLPPHVQVVETRATLYTMGRELFPLPQAIPVAPDAVPLVSTELPIPPSSQCHPGFPCTWKGLDSELFPLPEAITVALGILPLVSAELAAPASPQAKPTAASVENRKLLPLPDSSPVALDLVALICAPPVPSASLESQ